MLSSFFLIFVANNILFNFFLYKMKIALIGYGRMGHMIEEIAKQRGHEIICKIDVNNPDDFDSPEFSKADVAIEFTNMEII